MVYTLDNAGAHFVYWTRLGCSLDMLTRLWVSGKGTPRRKVKKVHKSAGVDDKKLQTSLKKLNVQPIQAIEEVNMFKSDGNVIHFAAPKGTVAQGRLIGDDSIANPFCSTRFSAIKHLCHLWKRRR